MNYRYAVPLIALCFFFAVQFTTFSESEHFQQFDQFSQLLVKYKSDDSQVLDGFVASYGKKTYVYTNDTDTREKLFYRDDVEVSPYEPEENLLETVHQSIHSSQAYALGHTGEDVVIGVFEQGVVASHTDFGNRLETREVYQIYDSGHKTHVAGIIGGGGVLSPALRGIAPESYIVSDDRAEILDDMDSLVTEDGMVASNHSTGISSCLYVGVYTSMSASFDDIMMVGGESSPHVAVISAGNSSGCSTDGYGTILGGIQQSKNAVIVGAVKASDDSIIANYSSRGPNGGGMIAPTVVSIGTVTSTCLNDTYCAVAGTSMSAPTVTGIVALMNEALPYNHNWVPSTYRTVLAHTAADLGNAGPDYLYGFGRVDAMRALEKTENSNQVYVFEIAPNQTEEVAINGQAGAPLKVTMGYADEPTPIDSRVLNSGVLVNDVDLRVEFTNGTTLYPYLLNPENPSAPASRGIDNRNVTEQVEGTFAVSGTHNIVVENTSSKAIIVTLASNNNMLLDPTAVGLTESGVDSQSNAILLTVIVGLGLMLTGVGATRRLRMREVEV